MAIGVLFPQRLLKLLGLMILAALLLSGLARAQDQIIKKDHSVVSGLITGCSDGQVTIQSRASNGGAATTIAYLSDIDSVTMPPPDAMAQLKADAPPATVIATLEPLIKQFAGLPANWVTDAMAQLGDAYDTLGQGDKASAVYDQINQLYPNSPYQMLAVTGKARQSLKAGRVDEALAAIQPIITEANQNLAPSPQKGRLYANAFLVYGQILEAQKKLPAALEAYLTVVTMFYQNPALVEKAGQLAKNLRDQNPGVGVD
jgi:tetratricopeptide (TPR) repeat protein